MSDEKRQQLKDIFDAALQQKPDQRQHFVNEKCGADETLRAEVESLLFSLEAAEKFMQDTAIAEVAEVMVGGNNPASGKCFGHYEIVKQIGVGGMGEVYLAKDTKLDRFVALKILNENFSRHEINRSRFIQEAKAASGLNHPNILVIHEIGETANAHFIVSEYIEGKTLREILANSLLNLSEILDISIQIANALATAHEAHLVHRDIKPENIMVRPDGFVKILDFGLAKLVEQKTSISSLANEITVRNETAKGIILGTVNYMSPEQAKGERVDARTDIFSLGVVIYEMIAGQTPFGCESVSETWTKLLHLEPAPLSYFVPDISGELEQIIAKMLRKEIEERYQTVKDLLTNLQAFKKRLEFEAEFERSSPPNKPSSTKTEVLEVKTTAVEISSIPPNNLTENFLPIIGREKEITEIQSLLNRPDVRLVTMTGIGGTGKTTLAKAVARESLKDFKDGVFFVGLAAIINPELVASTIAQPLGVNEAGGKPILEILKDLLYKKHLLLVVDNFEQVIDAAPIITELIEAAQELKIIITSRVLLHLSAEREFIVSPLAVPSEFSQISLEEFSKYDAIKLFVERAQKAKPSFALTEENARCVAEICSRLDGLPLAIELAAARIKILSPFAILAKLENRLKLLIGGARDLPARQQTMRGTVAWSYELLNEDEKTLFRRLAIFVGGFRFESAEAVCNYYQLQFTNDESSESEAKSQKPKAEINVLDGITSLIDKSLLVQKEQADGETRFRMLEIVREYSFEQLEKSGECETARQHHARYFLNLAEEAEPFLGNRDAVKWLRQLETEHDNIRAALQCSIKNDLETAMRIAGAIRAFWGIQGHLTEGRVWYEMFSGRTENISSSVCEKVFFGAGILSMLQGDLEAAQKFYQKSLQATEITGNKRQIALTNRELGVIASLRNNASAAQTFFEKSLEIGREINDEKVIALSLGALGEFARAGKDYQKAYDLFTKTLELFRKLSNRDGVSATLSNLGAVAFCEGKYTESRKYYTEALKVSQELGYQTGILISLDGFAALAVEQKDFERAARLAGAAQAVSKSIGYELEVTDRIFRENYFSELRATLSEEELNIAFEQGSKLKTGEILALLEFQS